MTPRITITSLLFLLVAAMTIGCNKPSQTDTNDDGYHVPRVEAQPFHGEIYRSLDGENAITLISSEELEMRDGRTTLLCKYSKQAGALRVIVTALGANQIEYFRITNAGLQDNDGKVLLSPKTYETAMEQARKKKELDEKVRQIEEEYEETKNLLLSTFNKAKNQLLIAQRKDENDVTTRHSDISLEINSAYDQQLNKARKTLERNFDIAEATISKAEKEEKERTEREERAEIKDLAAVKEAGYHSPTYEQLQKAAAARYKIEDINRRYNTVYAAIITKYGAALRQQRDKFEKEYQEEEARLGSEKEEKALQNDQSKNHDLKTIQVTYEKKMEALISKRDSDLFDLQKRWNARLKN